MVTWVHLYFDWISFFPVCLNADIDFIHMHKVHKYNFY